MGKVQGGLVAVRAGRAREGKTGRVALRTAPRKAFVGTAGKGQCVQQQGAAVGRGGIQSAAKLATVAPRGLAACTQHESAGGVGQKRRRQRQGPMGQAPPLEPQCGHGGAGRPDLLSLWPETWGKHGKQPAVLEHSSTHASVIETLDAHRFPGTALP